MELTWKSLWKLKYLSKSWDEHVKVYLRGPRPKTEAQHLGLNYIKRLKHLFCFVLFQVKISLHLSISSVVSYWPVRGLSLFINLVWSEWLGSVIHGYMLRSLIKNEDRDQVKMPNRSIRFAASNGKNLRDWLNRTGNQIRIFGQNFIISWGMSLSFF